MRKYFDLIIFKKILFPIKTVIYLIYQNKKTVYKIPILGKNVTLLQFSSNHNAYFLIFRLLILAVLS